MSTVERLLERIARHGSAEAITGPAGGFSYEKLLEETERSTERLACAGVASGSVVGLSGDFSLECVSLFLALMLRRCVIVPFNAGSRTNRRRLSEIAEVEVNIEGCGAAAQRSGASAAHRLYEELRRRGHAGLVLFSSGTSGEPKAAVHDLDALAAKFLTPRRAMRSAVFLMFDHIGGINTLLHVLSNGGTAVTIADRRPEAVCAAIEHHRIELLPTTPTFLNLLILSEAYRAYDLSSLKLITYGTEPMPQATLDRLVSELPDVRFRQTYGLAELGIFRSRSADDRSLWMQIGGDGMQWRIAENMLEIRTPTAMLGYLNAASPFTEDGWFRTGDAVEVDGEFIHVLGRQSELINVGGEKVAPAEVEGVLESMDGIVSATVFAKPNPVLGNIVCARVATNGEVTRAELMSRIRRHCAGKLDRYKIPLEVEIDQQPQFGERFKKLRAGRP
jgi:long-chain acyl-CoA synthetase